MTHHCRLNSKLRAIIFDWKKNIYLCWTSAWNWIGSASVDWCSGLRSFAPCPLCSLHQTPAAPGPDRTLRRMARPNSAGEDFGGSVERWRPFCGWSGIGVQLPANGEAQSVIFCKTKSIWLDLFKSSRSTYISYTIDFTVHLVTVQQDYLTT